MIGSNLGTWPESGQLGFWLGLVGTGPQKGPDKLGIVGDLEQRNDLDLCPIIYLCC